MPLSPFTIWTDTGRTRYFLLPDSITLPPGPLAIRAPLGKQQSVDPASLDAFELSHQQAQVWVASELTGLLQAIPKGPIDSGEKILATAHLVRTLPGIILDSANPTALAQARRDGRNLDTAMCAAGFETHSAFTHLPDRIATIQQDPEVREKRDAIQAELQRVSEQVGIPALRHFIDKLAGVTGNETE